VVDVVVVGSRVVGFVLSWTNGGLDELRVNGQVGRRGRVVCGLGLQMIPVASFGRFWRLV
jgi:hypothetical protein